MTLITVIPNLMQVTLSLQLVTLLPLSFSLVTLFPLLEKTIQHRFCLKSGEHKWFCGAVISYNPVAKTHEIAYEDEEEHQHYDHQHYDLTDDIEGGDIQVDNFDN